MFLGFAATQESGRKAVPGKARASPEAALGCFAAGISLLSPLLSPPPANRMGVRGGGDRETMSFVAQDKKYTGLLTCRPSCFQNRMRPHPQHTHSLTPTSSASANSPWAEFHPTFSSDLERTSKGVIKYVKCARNIHATSIRPWEGGRKKGPGK